jgi:pimeloyl-ACP methyl ester carboxylesterase
LRRWIVLCVIGLTAVSPSAAFALTNQVVLFTGFLAGSNAGMDYLNVHLASAGIPNYVGQVFEWSEQGEAADWILANASERATLVLIGHSFGGHSALQVANNNLKPEGIGVDLTIQIDSVANFDGGINNVLPTNVDVGFNYFQISTGFFEPQGVHVVTGATNINTEVLFGDTSITHTSIDNDTRLYARITQNIFDNLNPVSADFDSDGDIDGRDFLTWQRGESISPYNSAELAFWQIRYANSPFAAHTIPEPAGLALSMLVVMGLVTLRFSCRRKLLDDRRLIHT